MKLYFRRRLFWGFDGYDIYDYDPGDVVYPVGGRLAWVTVCTFWTQTGGTSPR